MSCKAAKVHFQALLQIQCVYFPNRCAVFTRKRKGSYTRTTFSIQRLTEHRRSRRARKQICFTKDNNKKYWMVNILSYSYHITPGPYNARGETNMKKWADNVTISLPLTANPLASRFEALLVCFVPLKGHYPTTTSTFFQATVKHKACLRSCHRKRHISREQVPFLFSKTSPKACRTVSCTLGSFHHLEHLAALQRAAAARWEPIVPLPGWATQSWAIPLIFLCTTKKKRKKKEAIIRWITC